MRHCDAGTGNWLGEWPRLLAQNWQIPLAATCAYLVGIVALKALVSRRGKFDVKGFAFYWNVFLSVFSWAGVFACWPVLLAALGDHGLYFATCAPAEWYGTGASGLFILFFVLSKLAELVDTVLLLLSGKPVILLHWWHHTTVMLYCWHSYSTRISTGIWFAAMNYFVHSIMYGYFAATQTSIRKKVFPYAMYITLLQLVQMLVGMFITIRAVLYQVDGQECHVNKTNSVLGLTMYFSYFVLFGKLFVDHYLLGKKAQPTARKQKSLVRTVSSKVIQAIDSDGDDDVKLVKRTASSRVVGAIVAEQALAATDSDDTSSTDGAVSKKVR